MSIGAGRFQIVYTKFSTLLAISEIQRELQQTTTAYLSEKEEKTNNDHTRCCVATTSLHIVCGSVKMVQAF